MSTAQLSVSPSAVTWKLFATITWRAAGKSLAISAPSAGGVIESSSPDTTRVGTAG